LTVASRPSTPSEPAPESTPESAQAYQFPFPHAPPQAQKLDEMLAKRGQSIDRVLNFMVPDALLV
jgi:hypothetical protein